MLSIGIVGGGPGGLIALYECRKRNLKATLYEKQSRYGGVWNVGSKEVRAHADTRFNTSNILSSFSLDDMAFINDKLYETDYLTSSQYQIYLKTLVEKYDLLKDMRFNQNVLNITEENETFNLNIFDESCSSEKKYNHDYIIICTGRNSKLKLPDESTLPLDIKVNKDLVWHSSFWDPLNNKSNSANIVKRKQSRILVIGGSHSAAESIQDTITCAKSYNSLEGLTILWSPTRQPERKNVWMLDRYPFGDPVISLPIDQKSCRFYNYFPSWLISRKMKSFIEPLLPLKEEAAANILEDTFCICDTKVIRNAVTKGIVQISKPILKVRKGPLNNILVDTIDESGMSVDGVIFATGFYYGDVKINDKHILLTSKFYRGIIPLDYNLHGRIGFVGTSKVIGSSLAILQIEVRWLLYQWFDKKSNWQKTFKALQSNGFNEGTVCNTPRFPAKVMHTLAKDMGMIPHVWWNLFSLKPFQRHVALAYLFGPIANQQYCDPTETIEAKYTREKYLVTITTNCFKRINYNFKFICILADVTFYSGAILSLYIIFNYIKFFLNK